MKNITLSLLFITGFSAAHLTKASEELRQNEEKPLISAAAQRGKQRGVDPVAPKLLRTSSQQPDQEAPRHLTLWERKELAKSKAASSSELPTLEETAARPKALPVSPQHHDQISTTPRQLIRQEQPVRAKQQDTLKRRQQGAAARPSIPEALLTTPQLPYEADLESLSRPATNPFGLSTSRKPQAASSEMTKEPFFEKAKAGGETQSLVGEGRQLKGPSPKREAIMSKVERLRQEAAEKEGGMGEAKSIKTARRIDSTASLRIAEIMKTQDPAAREERVVRAITFLQKELPQIVKERQEREAFAAEENRLRQEIAKKEGSEREVATLKFGTLRGTLRFANEERIRKEAEETRIAVAEKARKEREDAETLKLNARMREATSVIRSHVILEARRSQTIQVHPRQEANEGETVKFGTLKKMKTLKASAPEEREEVKTSASPRKRAVVLDTQQRKKQRDAVAELWENFWDGTFTIYYEIFSNPNIDDDPIFNKESFCTHLLRGMLPQIVTDSREKNGRPPRARRPYIALTEDFFSPPLTPTSEKDDDREKKMFSEEDGESREEKSS